MITFLDSLSGKLHTAFEAMPELKHYMYAFRVSIDVEHMFTIDRFQVDPKRFFGSDTNNKALEGIADEYKKEAMEARKEYQRIDKLISETSAKRAFTILKEAGLPLEEKEILNLPTALNRLQLDLDKLGIRNI